MCNLLLVEDDQKLRPVLVSVLDEAGYKVIPCATISEAKKMLKEHGIEIVVLDNDLPNGTGISLIKRIYPDISAIIMMGNPSPEVRNEATLCGVSAFLEKPFDEEDLVTVVDRVIKKDLGILPSDLKGGGGRTVGDDVNLQQVYSKIASISSRIKELTGEVILCKEVMGKFPKFEVTLEEVSKRTEKCQERGETIAVLQERAETSSVNWDRVLNLLLAVIQAVLILLVTKALQGP